MDENRPLIDVIDVDGRDLFVDAERLGGDVLVVLGTASCGACRRARQLLAVLSSGAFGEPPMAFFYVDAAHAMGLVEDWEVFHLPALMLLRDGEAWARVQAPLEAKALASAVRAARAGSCDPQL